MKVTTDVCDICKELGRPIKSYVVAEPESGRQVEKDLCAEHAAVLEALLEGAPLTTTLAAAPTEELTTSAQASAPQAAVAETPAAKPAARQSRTRTAAKKATAKKTAAKKTAAKKAPARRGLQVKTFDEIEAQKNA